VANLSHESENETVKRTLESSYSPESIRQAREKQDSILRDRLRHGPYKIADIGCGNGYPAVMFAPVCRLYHGFQISPTTAEIARTLWQRESVDNAQVFVGDVAESELEDAFYDVVL